MEAEGLKNVSDLESMMELKKYTSDLQTICKDARFFLMKSKSKENILLSKSQGVWSTLAKNEFKLNKAFRTSPNVILIFSVTKSGKFSGFARLASTSNRNTQINWSVPSHTVAQGRVFKVDWISKEILDFKEADHLKNPWNFRAPVKNNSDAQEIDPSVGLKLCSIFKMDPPILKKGEETREKLRSSADTGPSRRCRRDIGPNIPNSERPLYHYGDYAYSFDAK